MNKKIAFKNLKDFTNCLSRFTNNWWLEAGTCLGLVREGDFIEHDNDLDVGILAENFDWGILNCLVSEYDFKVKHIFGNRYKGFEIAFTRSGIKIDLFLFYKAGDKRWHGAWKNGGRRGDSDLIKLVFDCNLVENTIKENFRNISSNVLFNVPFNTVDYLEARYGKNWRIPNKRWNWADDPKCIDNNFNV